MKKCVLTEYARFRFQLQCCGLHTQADWVPNTPASCCSPGADTCTFINAYSTGCLSAFQDISLKTGMLGYFILAVAGVEVSALIRSTRSANIPELMPCIFPLFSCWASFSPAAWPIASATRSEGLRSKPKKNAFNIKHTSKSLHAQRVNCLHIIQITDIEHVFLHMNTRHTIHGTNEQQT